jgi:ribosomal protein S18 acetylase RimI-like enzyme
MGITSVVNEANNQDTVEQGLVKKATLTRSEIAAILDLVVVCDAHDGLRIRIPMDMLQQRSGPDINDFLYYEDGKLVGYLGAESWGKKEKEMTGMVHPDYRRRGIFRALFDAAQEELRGRAVQKLLLICEEAAQSGRAFLATTGAEFAYGEHLMELESLRERGIVKEGLSTRRAAPDDLEAIVSILASDTGNTDETRAWVSHLMQQPEIYRFYYATLNGEALGTLRLDFLDDDVEIYAFDVRMGYRGLGYGRQMLEEAIGIARSQNDKPIRLDVDTDNTNAIELYRSVGFKVITTYNYYELRL